MTSTGTAASATEMPSLSLPHAVPRRERLRLVGGLAALCALYATAHLSHLDPRRLSSTEGLRSVADLLHGFLKPDLSADFLLRVLTLMGESFAIGFVGLALALVIAIAPARLRCAATALLIASARAFPLLTVSRLVLLR